MREDLRDLPYGYWYQMGWFEYFGHTKSLYSLQKKGWKKKHPVGYSPAGRMREVRQEFPCRFELTGSCNK